MSLRSLTKWQALVGGSGLVSAAPLRSLRTMALLLAGGAPPDPVVHSAGREAALAV